MRAACGLRDLGKTLESAGKPTRPSRIHLGRAIFCGDLRRLRLRAGSLESSILLGHSGGRLRRLLRQTLYCSPSLSSKPIPALFQFLLVGYFFRIYVAVFPRSSTRAFPLLRSSSIKRALSISARRLEAFRQGLFQPRGRFPPRSSPARLPPPPSVAYIFRRTPL